MRFVNHVCQALSKSLVTTRMAKPGSEPRYCPAGIRVKRKVIKVMWVVKHIEVFPVHCVHVTFHLPPEIFTGIIRQTGGNEILGTLCNSSRAGRRSLSHSSNGRLASNGTSNAGGPGQHLQPE